MISGTLFFLNDSRTVTGGAVVSGGLLPAGVVTQQSSVISITVQTPAPLHYGQTVYFQVVVSPAVPGGPVPTGTIYVKDGNGNATVNFSIANGGIILNSNSFPLGDTQLTAYYKGDANYTASVSSPISFTLLPIPTTLTLTGPASASLNYPVTLTATVSNAAASTMSGVITFNIPGRPAVPVTVSHNAASYTYTPANLGELAVSANFAANAPYAASSDDLSIPFAKQVFSMSPYTPTALPAGTRWQLQANIATGQNFGFDPADTVTFYDGDELLATEPVVNGTASLPVQFFTPGIHTIRQVFSGDPNAEVPDSVVSLTITRATVINLMVLYTADVSPLVDGQGHYSGELLNAIDSVNNAFVNSGIPVTINLVHAQLVSFVETQDYQTDLNLLRNPFDGVMDEMYTLRKQYAADLVSLFVGKYGLPAPGDPPGTQIIGLGNELTTGAGDPYSAFSIIHDTDAGDSTYTLAHELGHNLGATHDPQNNPHKNPAFPSGQGYRFNDQNGNLVHDIMSYDPGDVIPYFSNPLITYNGVPEGKKGTSDAAHTIIRTAPVVSQYHLLIGAAGASSPPRGAIEVKTNQLIWGWAFDPDAGATSIKVRLDIDGVPGVLSDADIDRVDLFQSLGSTKHGFSIDTSKLPPGKHTLAVYMINAPDTTDAGSEVLLGQFTQTNPPPDGALEVANMGVIAGWAADKDMPTAAIQVRIDVDGNQGTPLTADLSRPDLVKKLGNADHGFSYQLPTRNVLGPHKIDVYFYDANTGIPYLFRTMTIKTTNALPAGKLDVANAHVVSGWVYDQNLSSDYADYQVIIDGQEYRSGALENRPDLFTKLGSTAHGFTFNIPDGLPLGKHLVSVYAINSPDATAPQDRVLIGRYTITNHLPSLTLEIANGSTISGWAFDPDVPTAPIDVRIAVDGAEQQANVYSGIPRPDLLKKLGSIEHGFSFDIRSNIPDGPHKIDIYVLDATSGEKVLVRTLNVDNTINVLPTGKIESVASGTITGWAFDQNVGITSLHYRVSIDGVLDNTFVADVQRDDLLKSLGSVFHGFSYNLPALSPGKHAISIALMDEPSHVWVPWKTLSVTL